MKTLRAGIIGTGFGGEVHSTILKHHPHIDVVSIATVTGKDTDTIYQNTGIKNVYKDWRKMIEVEKLDLLSVTSMPSQHMDMVIEALKREIPVLCEKPMAKNAQETKMMLEAQRQMQIPVFINFEWRYLPARLKVKELLDKKEIGEIIHVRYSVNVPMYLTSAPTKKSWFDNEEEGGMLGSLGSHMFDSLLWWLNSDITSVNGYLKNLFPTYIDEMGKEQSKTSDDIFMALGSFKNGASLSLEFLQSAFHGSQWRLEVYGTKGNIIMAEDKKVMISKGNEPYEELLLTPLPDSSPPEHIHGKLARYFEAFYPLINQLYETIAENKVHPYLPTFEDGHKVQMVMDAVRESSKKSVILNSQSYNGRN